MTANRFVLVIALLTRVSAAYAQNPDGQIKIVAPLGLDDVEGDVLVPAATFPFRSQEMWHASEFPDLPAGGAWLIAFGDRADASQQTSQTRRYTNVRFTFSTTQRDTPSLTFSENVGPDAVTVIDGPFEPRHDVDGDPPNPYFIWEFETPFFYDPANGNLLLDVASDSGLDAPFAWDAQDVGRPVANGGPGSNALVAAELVNEHIVTQFIFVPELPGTLRGDYNDSGTVEQADLDLVLLNWGTAFGALPAEWVDQRPTAGIVDQGELDGVLLNWGKSSAVGGAAGVPEPSSLMLVGLLAAFAVTGGWVKKMVVAR